MKTGYVTNAWGQGGGCGQGVTSLKDLYYEMFDENTIAYADIAAAGFSYVEIFEGNVRRYLVDKEKFKDDLQRYGLQICAVYTGANFVYKDAQDDEISRIRDLCEILVELKVPNLIVGGGAIRYDGAREEDYETLAKGLNQVSDLAASYGILAGYHPHLGTIVLSEEEIDRIMSMTTIDLFPDIAHIAAGGSDPYEIVRKYIERIHYSHIRDYQEDRFRVLGEGSLRVSEILDLLSDRYGEQLCFSVESADGACDDPVYAVNASEKYLKHYWDSKNIR